jgi:ParB-like chromosome segregation protein Spo0J
MTVTTPPVPDTNHPNTGVETVIRLRPEQVGQHPDNIRDAGRDIPALAASIKEVGVLVPLIVVPAHTIDGDWPAGVTHIAVDGNRRAAAAAPVGADLPCMVRDNTTTARETATVMAVTGPARDGLTGAEQAHAVQTMLDLGLSQVAIGRATGMKPTTVKPPKPLPPSPGTPPTRPMT